MAASTYTQQNVLNAALRAVDYPKPTGTYLSLHTGDPGATGANEAGAGWTAYQRAHAEQGGAIGSGWSAADANGESKNAKQVACPSYNGAGTITITHFGVWDAQTGGNFITGNALATPRTLEVGGVLVFDINALTVKQV